MPFEYANQELLHTEDFADFNAWHHEGIGRIEAAPGGGMRLHCLGSRQGREACMAFFRPTLPDQVAIEYDLKVLSQGGLMINYLGMRGLNGEDAVADRDKLPPRTGVMADYYDKRKGLQSLHVSVSRFNDKGVHTGTSNWRRNPGSGLVGYGVDPIREIGRWYHLRIVKDQGHGQLSVDGRFAHCCLDRNAHPFPVPDHGKFVFRLIGADVAVDVRAFRVYRVALSKGDWAQMWKNPPPNYDHAP